MSKHIVCHTCLATNRVPDSRLKDNPSCGKCQGDLFSDKTIDVGYKSWAKITRKSDIPVIIDFWAPWCGPCLSMAPIFNQAASQLTGDYILLKVNTEQEQQLSSSLGIRSIPTLVAYKNGKETNRVAGALPLQQLLQWIKSN